MTLNHKTIFEQIKSSFIPDTSHMPNRRYDLDWLRVLAFGLLILYHTGMIYVESWGFHVKSTYQSQFLENIMLTIEPWRMAILWLISGISIRFILAKVSIKRFIAMRSYRLLLPLLFGILVVVPPQLYIEMTFNGDLNMNYWQFLHAFFTDGNDVFIKYQSGIWPHIDVNHLWFIRALWQFSLLMLIFLPLLNSQWIKSATLWLFKQHGVVAIFIAILPLFVIQIFWDTDTTRYPLGFAFMVYGYLIGWEATFWKRLDKAIKPLLITLFVGYCSLLCFYNLVWSNPNTDDLTNVLKVIGMFNYTALRIIGVLTALTLAVKFLNKKSKKLNYLNDSVYPFYILHQTIIVVVGYNLSLLALGPVIEPMLLIVITVLGCISIYELIRRSALLRPCFGLKAKRHYHPMIIKLGYITAGLLIMPIAWKVFNWSIFLVSTIV